VVAVPSQTYAWFQCGGCGENTQEVHCLVHLTGDPGQGFDLEVNEPLGPCINCDDPNWVLLDRGF
jgi:hypothetical protein